MGWWRTGAGCCRGSGNDIGEERWPGPSAAGGWAWLVGARSQVAGVVSVGIFELPREYSFRLLLRDQGPRRPPGLAAQAIALAAMVLSVSAEVSPPPR